MAVKPFCPNPACPDKGQSGRGTISIHSQKKRRYRCTTCRKTFAATRGTALYRLHHPVGLMVLVVTLLCHGCPTQAIVIIETNRGLLITALLEASLPVYPVNPKTVDRRRTPAGAKTDIIDAYLLARTGRSDLADLRRLTPDSPLVAELTALTRGQNTLIQSQTRLVNQLTACLKAYYPVALELFGKLRQPTTLAFLQAFPTPEQARAASVARTHDRMSQPHLRADPAVTRTKTRLMLTLAAQPRVLLPEIAAYDEEITRLFRLHSDSRACASLPQAGTRLLAEWGDDRGRDTDAAGVQALAGAAPVPFQSGNFAKAHRRYALQQFAWQSTRKEAWALTYYQRKRRAGKSHAMAVRALANQWVHLIYALWAKHETYDPATFLAAQQAHAPRAA